MTTGDRIWKKLIRTGAGRLRFAMATIGLSVALLLILVAVQLQVNYNTLLKNPHNRDSIANFLVVNKQLNNETLGNSRLTDAEITHLRQQPFTESVGLMRNSAFKASIQSISDRFPFYTDVAFESVPDSFLDVNSKDWHWTAGEDMVPIVIPTMFLDIYNFQFALSQGLPQLTPEVVKMIVFRINLYTPAGTAVSMRGRVVGFSDRISSMLVPENFLSWANRNFGNGVTVQPSRVILRTKDPGNPALSAYLQEKGLKTDADKTRFSRYRQIVDVVVSISWVTGLLLLLFALLIFTLFIQLTITACRDEIRLLITLGASPKQLQRFLMRQFFPPNILIIVVVCIIITVLQYVLQQLLAGQQAYIQRFPAPETGITALFLLGLIWCINLTTIRKNIKK